MGASKDELKRWAQEQDCVLYCSREEAAPLHHVRRVDARKLADLAAEDINRERVRRRMV